MKSLYFISNISLADFLNEDILAQILGMLITTLFLHYFHQRIIKFLKRILGTNYQLKGCVCFVVFICVSTFLVHKIPDRPSQKEVEIQQKKLKEEADFLEQLKWAEEGDAVFQDIVGYAYYEGRIVKKDYAKAVYWLKKSAKNGYCEGRYDLAFMYYNGYGVEKNYKQAAYWYEKSYEQVPMPKAQYSLANMYLVGDGVNKSISKALELYTVAADAKYSLASQKLGDMYFQGGNGIEKNYEKAVFWYSKAADDGKDRERMYFLGNIYYDGTVVRRDYRKAEEWYSKSANLEYIPAMQKLADMYYYGKEVSQDYQKAFFWHREVAMSAFFRIAGRSMLIIGDMCSEGLGVEKNYQEALKWYSRAAAPTPSTTPEVQAEARAKLRKLEEQLKPGSNERKAEEQYKLANEFFVKKDYNKAVNLYELAAERGHFRAKEKLEEIYSRGLAKRKHKISETSPSYSINDFNASITGDKVNIRTQPNTSSKVVKQLNAGHPVKATKQTKGKDGTWYFIQTASGTQGWVFGKYLKAR